MWDWWKIINLDEIKKPDVPERYLSFNLSGLGQTDVVVARGFNIMVLFQGYWLVPALNARNPFTQGNVGAFIDGDNNLWVGKKHEN